MDFNLKLVLITIFISFSSSSLSQITTTNGYVISNDNDTIIGRLEYSNSGFSDICVFVKNNSNVIEYLPVDQVNGFYISPNINFQRKLLNGENLFLQVLSKGSINLYFEDSGNYFYISNSTDSIVKLVGGTETVYIDKKPFFKENYKYKMQLKRCIRDTSYFKTIDNLAYDKKSITKLFDEINKSKDNESVALKNTNHLGLEIGYSIRSINLANVNYTMAIYSTGNDFDGQNNLRFHSVTIGVDYKRKIGKSKSYLHLSLFYDKMLDSKEERSGILYSYMTTKKEGPDTPGGIYGKVIDTYSSNQKSIIIPLSLYNEFANRNFRPFCDVGLSFRFYNKNLNINRLIYEYEELVEQNDIRVPMPSFVYGPKIRLGCRYLINAEYSISAGINAEYFRWDSPKQDYISSFFISTNF